ncbi:RHS repeat-associated core domain-containing protein [Rapidithrix thailandica]|uniref:RHS repeat-associated core domain-containing protein n=1 Tax=Rapidithrix thailandica TaxID=413964 RepID=A0AAW9SGD6_9BACT
MQGQQPGLRSVKCFRLFPTSRPPFGKQMAGRSYSDEAYRYSFNGKENDKDFGNQHLIQDYGFRLYNPEIGKFLSVDPLAPDYPWYTPYQFAGNTPIQAIDLDGAEPEPYGYSRVVSNNDAREKYVNKYGTAEEKLKLERDKNVALMVSSGIMMSGSIFTLTRTAVIAFAKGAGSEAVVQIGTNTLTNKPWYDFDYGDIIVNGGISTATSGMGDYSLIKVGKEVAGELLKASTDIKYTDDQVSFEFAGLQKDLGEATIDFQFGIAGGMFGKLPEWGFKMDAQKVLKVLGGQLSKLKGKLSILKEAKPNYKEVQAEIDAIEKQIEVVKKKAEEGNGTVIGIIFGIIGGTSADGAKEKNK